MCLFFDYCLFIFFGLSWCIACSFLLHVGLPVNHLFVFLLHRILFREEAPCMSIWQVSLPWCVRIATPHSVAFHFVRTFQRGALGGHLSGTIFITKKRANFKKLYETITTSLKNVIHKDIAMFKKISIQDLTISLYHIFIYIY